MSVIRKAAALARVLGCVKRETNLFSFFFSVCGRQIFSQRRSEMARDTALGHGVINAMDSCSALQTKNLSLGSLDSQTPPGSSRTRNISLSLSLSYFSLSSLSLSLSLSRSLARSLAHPLFTYCLFLLSSLALSYARQGCFYLGAFDML